MASFGTVTGSDLIAKSLEIEGVDTVFTLAGDHILPTLDCMSDRGFRFIDTRHEQAAAHMADAWGRITGRPGVAMYTTPGFANAMPGLANAMHSGSPLLSISGSAELHELGRGAMQEIDQVGMARPVTKSAWMVTDARRIPDMIATALRVAYEGRRGPVHLTIPVDIQQQVVGKAEVSLFNPGEYRDQGTSPTSLEKVRDAVAILREAERPLIIVGSAGAYSGSGEALQELVETARLPFMTEGDARGLAPDTHPYCYGFFDSGLNRAARLLREADAVVLMGRKQDLIVGYALPPTVSPDANVIQIDPSATEIGRNRGVAVGIAGDVEAVTRQMADEALKYAWDDHAEWRARLEAERSAQAESLDALARHESPMHAMYVHKAIRNHIRDDDFVVYDGGDFCHFGRSSTPALSPRTWLYLPTSGMLGQSLPTALAAKAAYPNRRVFMFTGDGAFGFNGMEFDTAVRHNLPIIGIMGNDSAWGIDKQIQVGVFGKPVVTDLLPSRYDQVVKGLGGYGELVEHPDELDYAVERAIKLDRPSLLNVRIQSAISPRAEIAIERWKSHAPLPM